MITISRPLILSEDYVEAALRHAKRTLQGGSRREKERMALNLELLMERELQVAAYAARVKASNWANLIGQTDKLLGYLWAELERGGE